MTRLLTQGNSDLRADRIWTWTLPALAARLDDGRTIKTCPEAGVCANLCYARAGSYRFSQVATAHRRNLSLVVDSPDVWERTMLTELMRLKATGTPAAYAGALNGQTLDPWTASWLISGGPAVRVHDSGDFFTEQYLDAWLRMAREARHVLLYAYTKQVAWVKARTLPQNVRVIFSMGGREDHLVDRDRDRHADVFPSAEARDAAGYGAWEERSDILAALHPNTRVGLVANNHRHLRKRQGEATFFSLQEVRRGPQG